MRGCRPLVAGYRGEYGASKLLQSDGNMPALLEQETSRFGRGSLHSDSLPQAAGRAPATVAARYNEKRKKDVLAREMHLAQLKTSARHDNDRAAGNA